MNIESKTLTSLEFNIIREELAKFAKFEQSRKLCLNIKPFDKTEKIQQQIKLTSEAKYILDLAKETPSDFVADIQKIKKNALTSYLEEQELIDVAKTLRNSRLLKRFIINNSKEDFLIKESALNLVSDKSTEDRIFEIFDENLRIKQNATPELKGLYSSLKDTEQNLRDTVNSLLNNSDFTKNLQDNIYTQRDERIVFQVIASNKNKIPGIVHDVSSSAKTFYIEPAQIVPFNNKIR